MNYTLSTTRKIDKFRQNIVVTLCNAKVEDNQELSLLFSMRRMARVASNFDPEGRNVGVIKYNNYTVTPSEEIEQVPYYGEEKIKCNVNFIVKDTGNDPVRTFSHSFDTIAYPEHIFEDINNVVVKNINKYLNNPSIYLTNVIITVYGRAE